MSNSYLNGSSEGQSRANLYEQQGDYDAMISSAYCFMDYKVENGNSAWGVHFSTYADLQGISLYKNRINNSATIKFRRTRKHILADPCSDFILSIPLAAQTVVSQGGKQSICKPETFRLLSLSLPFSTYTPSVQSSNDSAISARISGSILRQLIPDIDNYPNLVIQIRPGVGRIMKSMVMAGLTEGNMLSVSEAKDYGKAVIASIAKAVLNAPEFELHQARTHESSYERVFEAAKEFIMRNLSDPMLDCAAIAEHCQVSKTYLHMVFASVDLKVGAFIRELRLQYCRGNLADPRLAHHKISEIMTRWGFVDISSFGKAYKARFGKTPSEDRSHAEKFVPA